MGAPSKGHTSTTVVRLPGAVHQLIKSEARRRGYESMNDFLVATLSREVGKPELAPRPAKQDELPMTG